ncbi:entericidin A/B family lipoprotein [uncultured Methylophaga sp.]
MKIISLLIAFCLTCVVTGCNTIEGMGKDVEAAGDAIEKKASENKNY